MLIIKHWLYLVLILSAAFAVLIFSHSPQSYWVIWTVLLLSFLNSSLTFKQKIISIFLTGLGMVLVVGVGAAVSHYVWTSLVFLAVLMGGGYYLSWKYAALRFSLLLITLLGLVTLHFPATLTVTLIRVEYIVLGIGITVLAQLLFWPHYVKNEINLLLNTLLVQMRQLNEAIFACLLQPDYVESAYLFERHYIVQRSACLNTFNQLQAILQANQDNHHATLSVKFDVFYQQLFCLFAIMLDYAQVRLRVTDHSTFAVIQPELLAVKKSIQQALQTESQLLNDKRQVYTTNLSESIAQLVEKDQQILQVVAKEPIVFLLFIDSLQAFCKQWEECCKTASTIGLRL